MPLLFYFPFILWAGMMSVAEEEMRPIPVKARK
jgi:hypothetical protein